MNRTILAAAAVVLLSSAFAAAGATSPLHVLPPVTHGNLSIFPVVGGPNADTSHLLTLDEGLRSGAVIVTEASSSQGLIRRQAPVHYPTGAEVNRLVLVNNSDRPLLLLAGEVVTGGKQDRVIGADRLVPANSGPIDLSVFCVEPGRWVGQSDQFASLTSQMAQPSVRVPAMAAGNQQEVWNQVAAARSSMAMIAPPGPTTHAGTSYARTMQAPEVQDKIKSVAADYDGILRELRKAGAKGVVVAINGKITWADLFASTDLLEKYWQKLIRSYAAESLTNSKAGGNADQKAAQAFIDQLAGNREVIETEPGIFRRAEITGEGYKVFTLTALNAKPDFEVHVAKMAYNQHWPMPYHPDVMMRPDGVR